MRPRVSILNLLLVTTIVALVIVILRLSGELETEKRLRAELLRKGGVLEISDLDAVQLVHVSSVGEPRTLRWRVYVPEGRMVTLNARLESVTAEVASRQRLPPNAIVVADKAPSNPVRLKPGENVLTLDFSPAGGPYLRFDVVSDGWRAERYLRAPDGAIDWFQSGYGMDLSPLEDTTKRGKALRDGRTVTLDDGKTFMLCRFRDPRWRSTPKLSGPSERVGEVLVWLQVDGG